MAGHQLHARTVALVVAVLALALPAGAAAGAPSDTPDHGIVTDGAVESLARVGDTLYIGGAFGQVGLATGPGVSLSRATGARDTAFPAVMGGQGQVFAVVGDGS